MSLDAMKQALEALEECIGYKTSPFMERECEAAITALRAAIEQAQPDELMIWKSRAMNAERIIEKFMQPEQEPVAWMNPSWIDPDTRGWASDSFESIQIEGWIPLYTAPRQWQGLTDEEIKIIWRDIDGSEGMLMRFARAIEAKLKERNT